MTNNLSLHARRGVHPAEPDQRHDLFADLQNFLPIDDVNFALARAQNLQHIAQGHGVEALARRGRAGP